jgi:hypothetical protein
MSGKTIDFLLQDVMAEKIEPILITYFIGKRIFFTENIELKMKKKKEKYFYI